jgi:hypothetical protein
MSIAWGKEQRIKFQGGWKLGDWTPPESPGVYAITYKQDNVNRPKSHTVVYFGESGNVARQGLPWSHECARCWLDQAGAMSELYVFFHPMPHSTQHERWLIYERLVSEYRPMCNRH